MAGSKQGRSGASPSSRARAHGGSWSHADRARLEALEAYRAASFEHLAADRLRLMWTTLIATAVSP